MRYRRLGPALLGVACSACVGGPVDLGTTTTGHPSGPAAVDEGGSEEGPGSLCAAETCDGTDDDCDGPIDEWDPDTNPRCVVSLPAASFDMGCVPGDLLCAEDERPRHRVTLGAYAIAVHETEQGAYAECVDAGWCAPPNGPWDPALTPHHPVGGVTRSMARRYCQWRGGDVPTEAQWEHAARGAGDGLYPMGNAPPACARANTLGCAGGALSVGLRPTGRSPEGLFDMAGNLLEWTRDRYDPLYYSVTPDENPVGPSTGDQWVVRGGSFLSKSAEVRSSARFVALEYSSPPHLGFRCAWPL